MGSCRALLPWLLSLLVWIMITRLWMLTEYRSSLWRLLRSHHGHTHVTSQNRTSEYSTCLLMKVHCAHRTV